MKELQLPEELQGPWDNALILSYGVDLPFFENALWRQFGPSCRNKVILGDGRHYLAACNDYASTGLVRHLNHRYVAEGIFSARAAHAKLILLTNGEQGRLLVGSGNLSLPGYASGGELFVRYMYAEESTNELGAFVAVREFIEGLLSRRYLSSNAERQVGLIFEKTPWLYQTVTDDLRPVRHNLETSFLEQLRGVVGEDEVEELWVLSPFYDENAVGLRSLLQAFSPKEANLLVQAGRTSVKPSALRAVIEEYGGRCQVIPFHKGDVDPYVHAKLFLLKCSDRAICLQGSPNLSQVAMLLTPPNGNLELANLLTGHRKAFDDVLSGLSLLPAAEDLDALELTFQSGHDDTEALGNWYVTSGELLDDRLRLTYRGARPTLKDLRLLVDGRPFSVQLLSTRPDGVELKIPAEAVDLLRQPVPLVLRIGHGPEAVTSNAIFVCNRAVLSAYMESSPESESLGHVGDLNLGDDEIERLLGELEAALVIDRRSVWQLAGRKVQPGTDEKDDALQLRYIDVNYEVLRNHPRVQQYLRARGTGESYGQTRLQLILNSIVDHFRGFLDAPPSTTPAPTPPAGGADGDGDGAETEEEREKRAAEQERRTRSRHQRVQLLLKNFVRRYLSGIGSQDFREFVGHEVMTQNYVIFSHLLWRMLLKDLIEARFAVQSLLDIWSFAWGDGKHDGYFHGLGKEDQEIAFETVKKHEGQNELLAVLYFSSGLARTEHWEDLRFGLRDFLRWMLTQHSFLIRPEHLENAKRILAGAISYQPPTAVQISTELADLARFETRTSLRKHIAKRHHYWPGACNFTKVLIKREHRSHPEFVDCLVIEDGGALADIGEAVDVLQCWMRAEDLDYYRVWASKTGRVTFYDTDGTTPSGVYWAKDRHAKPVDFGPGLLKRSLLDETISNLGNLAVDVDAKSSAGIKASA